MRLFGWLLPTCKKCGRYALGVVIRDASNEIVGCNKCMKDENMDLKGMLDDLDKAEAAFKKRKRDEAKAKGLEK